MEFWGGENNYIKRIIYQLFNRKLQGNRFLLFLLLFLQLFLSNSCEQPEAIDWRGMNIKSIKHTSGESPVSNELNIIHFYWVLNKDETNFSVGFNLFSTDRNTHISLIGSKSVTVKNGLPGHEYFYWDGKMTGSRDRKVPVPPGSYSVQLRYFDQVHKYEWHNITVNVNTWDIDNDNISNAIEDENAGNGGPVTTISYEGNTYYYNKNSNTQPPVLPLDIPTSSAWYRNRGTHDYSLARGTVSSGTLTNGLRIANSGTGYQYWWGGDTPDTDNWGTLELINLVERVARAWRRLYPDYPLITSMDISKQNGGDWRPDHTSHQNGLDVDMRYIRNDNTANPFDFNNLQDYNPSQGINYYNQTATQKLINLFLNSGAIIIFVDSRSNLSGSGVQEASGHHHHFHVRIADPDGTN